jgi:hypothetical protein
MILTVPPSGHFLIRTTIERRWLERAGRDDMARNVRWVSDLDGDGYDCDVQSFEADSEQRLLESRPDPFRRCHIALTN